MSNNPNVICKYQIIKFRKGIEIFFVFSNYYCTHFWKGPQQFTRKHPACTVGSSRHEEEEDEEEEEEGQRAHKALL